MADIIKKVKSKNTKSGFASLSTDEMLMISNEPSTLKVVTYGGKVLCRKKIISLAMIKAALENKMSIEGTSRSYYLMSYK